MALGFLFQGFLFDRDSVREVVFAYFGNVAFEICRKTVKVDSKLLRLFQLLRRRLFDRLALFVEIAACVRVGIVARLYLVRL